ncbi:MAG: branched-chain amino acid ABC transporter permease [Candidatus Bathyarchaeia archaeon]
MKGSVTYSKIKVVLPALAVAMILLSIIPFIAGKTILMDLILILFYIAAAQWWNFMSFHAGMVFLAPQMFMAIGAYTTIIAMAYYEIPFWGAFILSGVISVLVAAGLSVPLLRMRGMYFAIGSIIAGELFSKIFSVWDYVGGGAGITLPRRFSLSLPTLYYWALFLALVSTVAVYIIYKSKIGYALRAIGSDELAATEFGINSFIFRMLCFILSAFFLGLSGSIYIQYTSYIDPFIGFSALWSITIIFISFIGAYGRILGPVIGSVISVELTSFTTGFAGLTQLIQGIAILAILFLFPDGIWGWISKKLKIPVPF